MPENPPTRVWNKGQMPAEELNSLLHLFRTDEFASLDDYYQFPGKPLDPILGMLLGDFTIGGGRFKFTINYGKLQETVHALGYLTPNKGLTYPDMPYPLNEIFQRLRVVIEDKIQEVYREPIGR